MKILLLLVAFITVWKQCTVQKRGSKQTNQFIVSNSSLRSQDVPEEVVLTVSEFSPQKLRNTVSTVVQMNHLNTTAAFSKERRPR